MTINLDTDLGDDEAIGKMADRGQRTTGGFDGPRWVPMLHEKWNPDLKPEALAVKVAKSGKGSTTRQSITGKLVAAYAWGRRFYFVDVTVKNETVRVMVPESKTLYPGLNLCELGATVALRLDGKGKPSKPGRKPPWNFTVSSIDKPALAAARKDSLVALSMDERDAIKAKNQAARDAIVPPQDGEPEADDVATGSEGATYPEESAS